MTTYAVDKVEVILTVPSIEETQACYKRVLGGNVLRGMAALCVLGFLLVFAAQIPRASRAEKRNANAPPSDGIYISEILAANTSTNLTPDLATFSDWIEIHNARDRPVDLSGYYLTDDLYDPTRWEIPAGTWIEPDGFKLFWADGRNLGDHTNFGLSKTLGKVGLFAANGDLVDAITYKSQLDDVSFGRESDQASNLVYFGEPSPGAPNNSPGFSKNTTAPSPHFSLPSGSYDRGTMLALDAVSPAAVIRYTQDGSTPIDTSPVYTSPIHLGTTVVLKARSFQADRLPSPVVAHTYLIDERFALPVVSLTTAPLNLWDVETGIYVDQDVLTRKEWERPAFVEFFESDGTVGFSSNVDIRLFGSTAIDLPQKSMAVFIRENDGAPLRYRLFPDEPVDRFHAFILRSSSDDWHRTMFLDAMTQQLVEPHLDLDTQSYRPAVLLLNGVYFGIHNIREKINQDYIASHYDQNPDNIDLLFMDYSQSEPPTVVLNGDEKHYEAMLARIMDDDIRLPATYAYVETQIDIDNAIDYYIAEIYVGNTSWYRNRKIWRPRTDSGRWRFLFYDLDRGFIDPNVNMLEDMIRHDPLFESLLRNPTFRQTFIQRFAAQINITFHPDRVIEAIDRFQSGIAPEMPRHIARWKEECNASVCGISSLIGWEANVEELREFARQRPAAMRQQIVDAFRLSGTAELKLDCVGQGKIRVNQVAIPEEHYTGIYFRDIPLELMAVADPGYRFVGWQGEEASPGPLSITLHQDTTMTAVFERIEQPNAVLAYWGSAGLLGLFLLIGAIRWARQRQAATQRPRG